MTDPLDKIAWADPWWRLNNLYTIVTDEGVEMRFTPNEEQAHFYANLHNRGLILKARQLGFTTFVALLMLDQCVFNRNFTGAVIAHSLPDARKIFRNKVLFPYSRLPNMAKLLAPLEREAADELVFGNGSSISVSTSARSGTVQLLHVSEMGKIARKYPHKAREIVTGSFEAVPKDGIVIVESTAEGKAGWFHDAVQVAKRRRDQGGRDTELDFRLHFYPWWTKPSYRIDPSGVVFTDADLAYFTKVELVTGARLDAQQRAWYVKKAATLRDDVKREHPSFEDEAFESSDEGVIYAKEMRLLRSLGRIGQVPLRAGIPVNTFWDLGVNDTNFIWLHQRVGAMNRFVKCFLGHNEGISYYWNTLETWRSEHKATWGRHYLPHDGDHRIQGYDVATRKEILESCGAREVRVVPRIHELRDGIELVRRVLPECEMDEQGCVDGIACLDNYSREWDEEAGRWSSQPRHDKHSNGADAIRQFAQGYEVEAAAVSMGGLGNYGTRSGY